VRRIRGGSGVDGALSGGRRRLSIGAALSLLPALFASLGSGPFEPEPEPASELPEEGWGAVRSGWGVHEGGGAWAGAA
jgi:hypothetical protein